MESYSSKEWHQYREAIIRQSNGQCSACGRSRSDGVRLQVHHKRYVRGLAPWEHDASQCEVLCRGCHASEHGLLRPKIGWTLTSSFDHGGLDGQCDLCGSELRYAFMVEHSKWQALEVGETCCDHLTGSEVASNHLESLRRYVSRKKRFIDSRSWQAGASFRETINRKGTSWTISPDGSSFRILISGHSGRMTFPTKIDAKGHLFDIIENGQAEAFIESIDKDRRSAAVLGRVKARFALRP